MKIEIDFDAVELGEPALGEAPESLNAVDVSAALCKGLLFVNADMLVVADIDEAVISRPAIGTNDALGIDPSADDGAQSVLGAVLDDLRVNFPIPLKDAEDGLLECSTSAQPGQGSATHPARTKVAFIDFHHSSQFPALIDPMQGNQQPKTLVQRVDGLAIELQKSRCLRSREVQAKAFHYFFDAILA